MDTITTIEPAPWKAVAFVCGRCEDRKGAPKGLDAKRVGKALREGFREEKLRSRVMTTGCMGLCPRGAVVAAIGLRGEPLVVAELKKKRELQGVVAQLVAKPADIDITPSPQPLVLEGNPA